MSGFISSGYRSGEYSLEKSIKEALSQISIWRWKQKQDKKQPRCQNEVQ